MADKSNAAARQHLRVDTPPQQIPRDLISSDNSIPLSPQWLLPKPGDNRSGIINVESHFSPSHANRPDIAKAPGFNEEFPDGDKQSITSWSSTYDAEGGRQNRWRDEERETNSAVRKDRWRDGDSDKDLVESRRERRSENSSRFPGEVRRTPSDRWNETPNRDANFDYRRESKWSSRWGPDDKDSDGWREKKIDSVRDVEVSRDNGLAPQAYSGKEEKDGENHSRPWRPSSFARGRGDSSFSQSKQGQPFGYWRGRGENGSSTYSVGRGKYNPIAGSTSSSSPNPSGALVDAASGDYGDSSLRYARTRLLDIYRMMDLRNYRKPLDGFVDVPFLTQMELLEPLALSTPSPDELAILKSIDVGDTISSGISRTSKDVIPSGPFRAGMGEDMSSMDDSKGEVFDKFKNAHQGLLDHVSRKHMNLYGPDQENLGQSLRSFQDGTLTVKDTNPRDADIRELSSSEGSLSSRHGIPSRAELMGESDQILSKTWRDFPGILRSSDPASLQLQKNQQAVQMSNDPASSPFYIKRVSSEVLDTDRDATKLLPHDDSVISGDNAFARRFQLQPSPEDLILCYKDPQGQVQGPFSGADLIGWFEAGYFGLDLQVHLFDAPADAPFSSLGDIMPHLQMKAKPPPGFTLHKQNENFEALPGNMRPVMGAADFNSGQRIQYEPKSSTEAENRYLESLMAGNLGARAKPFPFSEGVKGYVSSSPGASTVGVEQGKGLDYLLAQRLSLEKQQALPNPLPFWSGTGPASLDLPSPGSKNLLPLGDTPPSAVSQGDLLQAVAYFHDPRSLKNGSNSGVDVLRDNIDLHHNPNQHFSSPAGYGIPSQRLHQQSQPPLSHIVTQPGSHPPGVSQDPNILSVLQQQYMLSQLQLQSHMSIPSQLSLFDKLILMEHQKQEQQLLLQQQHLLSQILSEQRSQQQHFVSAPGQMGLPHMLDTFQMNNQMPPLNLQDVPNLPAHAAQGLGGLVGSTPAVDHTIQSKEGTGQPEGINNPAISDPLPPVMSVDDSLPSKEVQAESSDVLPPDNAIDWDAISRDQRHKIHDASEHAAALQQEDDTKSKSEDVPEHPPVQSPSLKLGKAVEISPAKKASDKKSKKQKNAKAQATLAQSKGPSKMAHSSQLLKQDSEDEGVSGIQACSLISSDDNSRVLEPPEEREESAESRNEVYEDVFAQQANLQLPATRAWKPAPAPKAKSLLEIQQEEQRRAQIEVPLVPEVIAAPVPARWSGVVTTSAEHKLSEDVIKAGSSVQRKSQLHDLLAEEVISMPTEERVNVSTVSAVEGDDFVEAKDSKKSRKKAAKVKGAAAKNSGPIVSPDVTPTVMAGKTKATARQVQQEREKEVSSVLPAGPSLGDFVFWKADQAGSAPAPPPAWSTDSMRAQKPASLRDILKEEEKKTPSASKQIAVAAPAKAQQGRNVNVGNSPWLVSATSPSSKVLSPVTKSKAEDDLFWGPLDHPKPEMKLPSIPAAVPGIWGGKGSSTAPSRTDYSLSSPPAGQSLSKGGRRDAMSKHSEAAGFREWCESELLRLTGTRDASFLEFCMKQSTSEARTLLKENLGSLDRDHAFIEKLLNYKELLPADVVELAFQAPQGRGAAPYNQAAESSVPENGDADPEGSGKGGGRKKGKKGKKVSPAVLGFSVVSNRIMMGEIQNVED